MLPLLRSRLPGGPLDRGVGVAASGQETTARKRSRRGAFLKWLRRIHAWLGLWGAVMGLLFGGTGILLNHRATLKIPAAKVEETLVQLKLSQPLPGDPQALAAWLQHELDYREKPPRIKVDAARMVVWNNQPMPQPERWQISFDTPRRSARAEYWVGNYFVSVQQLDPNVFAFLTRLHMATGANVAWILLADSIAGSIIVLALSGILLWTRMHGPKLAAAGLAAGALGLGVWFAWLSL